MYSEEVIRQQRTTAQTTRTSYVHELERLVVDDEFHHVCFKHLKPGVSVPCDRYIHNHVNAVINLRTRTMSRFRQCSFVYLFVFTITLQTVNGLHFGLHFQVDEF